MDMADDRGQQGGLIGRSIRRIEDAALLCGRGRYADDLPTTPSTLQAHIIRSPHAHARILRIDAAAALAYPGVSAVITGEDIQRISDSFLVALKAPVPQWSLAVERVRYVGEPVVLVVAQNRYLAEDAAELVQIDYEKLAPVIDPLVAVTPDAPILHEAAGTNEVSNRQFVYGDPDTAFERADRIVALTVNYPRSSYTPMECFVVVAEHRPADGGYDVLANFQGPFSAHPVMARALRVSGSKLRLRIPPDSGGSFGSKLSIFPYIVLMALAARITGRPVKWVEDRLEHLQAASSGPNRVTKIEAAVTNAGRILGLRLDQLEDYGAFLRAPMPGPLYRMHGATTGAYDVHHLAVTNRVVLTNKAPAGLIRGFGGPQLYFALERLVQRIAVELGIDHLEVIRRNLISADSFPYRAAAGALYDSGDYPACLEETVGQGRLSDLQRRRDQSRAAGKYYGIGFAAVVEPGMSNMGYLSTLLAPSAREKAGPKNGAVSMATVNVDALGAVSVTADVTVQGQGHATVLAQIVAERLGLGIDEIQVNLELDTQKDPWSIAAGTYSCRFSPGTAVAADMAVTRIRDKLAQIAAKQLNVLAHDIEFSGGQVRSRSNPDNAIAFGRVAGTAHWSPVQLPEGMEAGLRETAVWSPPQLEPPNGQDQINTSLTYGFVFDMCGVEIDPVTYQTRVDRYVSMHDAGRLLNPMIAEGQIRGAFAQGLASALYEEFVYDGEGAFLSGTFADYLVPTAMEIPPIEILHQENPSPFTTLGAKGLAEGNCMSTPVCVANAIADALGIISVQLPATPERLHALLAGDEPSPPSGRSTSGIPALADTARNGRDIRGRGAVTIAASPQRVWKGLLDPVTLKAVIPGCQTLESEGENRYRAIVSLGVGPVRGVFQAVVELSDLDPERSGRLSGSLSGPLGAAHGSGLLRFSAQGGGTRIDYEFVVGVSGKAAAIGGRLMQGAADVVVGQFFERFGRVLGAPVQRDETARRGGLLDRLLRSLGLRR